MTVINKSPVNKADFVSSFKITISLIFQRSRSQLFLKHSYFNRVTESV